MSHIIWIVITARAPMVHIQNSWPHNIHRDFHFNFEEKTKQRKYFPGLLTNKTNSSLGIVLSLSLELPQIINTLFC